MAAAAASTSSKRYCPSSRVTAGQITSRPDIDPFDMKSNIMLGNCKKCNIPCHKECLSHETDMDGLCWECWPVHDSSWDECNYAITTDNPMTSPMITTDYCCNMIWRNDTTKINPSNQCSKCKNSFCSYHLRTRLGNKFCKNCIPSRIIQLKIACMKCGKKVTHLNTIETKHDDEKTKDKTIKVCCYCAKNKKLFNGPGAVKLQNPHVVCSSSKCKQILCADFANKCWICDGPSHKHFKINLVSTCDLCPPKPYDLRNLCCNCAYHPNIITMLILSGDYPFIKDDTKKCVSCNRKCCGECSSKCCST